MNIENSNIRGFIEAFNSNNKLRRKSTGIVKAPIGSHEVISQYLDTVIEAPLERLDLMEQVAPNEVDSLTADKLYNLCVPGASSKMTSSRIIYGFDALFVTLNWSAQDTLSARLAHTEPQEPYIILVHSPYTKNRLSDNFSEERITKWVS